MLTTGERNRNKNLKIKWESAQVNRAGRVKGAGASEDGTPIFGIMRRNVRTMICHVLLNDTNPDTSFNWNKVKFDDLHDKPRTRQLQSLIQKPEAYMESLKQKYIEKKALPLKRMRSNAAAAAGDLASTSDPSSTGGPSVKRRRLSSSPLKKRSSGGAVTASALATSSSCSSIRYRKSSDEYDEFGFESEAED